MTQFGERLVARQGFRGKRVSQLLRRTMGLWEYPSCEVADQIRLYSAPVRSVSRTVRAWRRWEEIGEKSGTIIATPRAVLVQGTYDLVFLCCRSAAPGEAEPVST